MSVTPKVIPTEKTEDQNTIDKIDAKTFKKMLTTTPESKAPPPPPPPQPPPYDQATFDLWILFHFASLVLFFVVLINSL